MAATVSSPTSRRDPEATKGRILDAAEAEFAHKGFGLARVDAIAARARINKRMLYHYFGNKHDLYAEVLERAYTRIRSREVDLRLEEAAPDEAIRRLVRFTWQYQIEHPEFGRLLQVENLLQARHLREMGHIRDMHVPLVGRIRDVLDRGVEAGQFRAGVDPVQLYISIAGLVFFYFSNQHTLSVIFDVDLASAPVLAAREAHIVEVILSYLRA